MNESILMVDDDLSLSPMTKEYLEAKRYCITLVHSGEEGLNAFKASNFDLCILDIQMPMKDGYLLAEDIRAIDPQMPIIFLTGLHNKKDRIKGLTLGADDYITKPFSMEELYLRINNILKRIGVQSIDERSQQVEIGLYTLDPESRVLTGPLGNRKLTAIESQLLSMLYQRKHQVLSRDAALVKIWGDDQHLHGRSLNVYISKLRTFLKEDDQIEILNVHGVGYKLVFK